MLVTLVLRGDPTIALDRLASVVLHRAAEAARGPWLQGPHQRDGGREAQQHHQNMRLPA